MGHLDSCRADGGPSSASAVAVFTSTVANATRPPASAPEGMVWIPGGEFSMGAADPQGADRNEIGMHATEDSRPIHRVFVDGFWMDTTEVTNEQFERFVRATGYVTVIVGCCVHSVYLCGVFLVSTLSAGVTGGRRGMGHRREG